MSIPNKRQQRILLSAMDGIAKEIENNEDVFFANDLVDFINRNPRTGDGMIGYYGTVLD